MSGQLRWLLYDRAMTPGKGARSVPTAWPIGPNDAAALSPAGVVSAGRASTGLPVALQVIGRQLDDLRVLQAIAAMEDLYGLQTLS